MRRRLLASSVVLAGLLVAPVSARADVGQFIPGETIDGPVTSLGDLDVARDGTGAVVYVKPVGGVDHVFVSRLQDGAWQPPEQLDAGLAASSQPVVAAGDGGKLAIGVHLGRHRCSRRSSRRRTSPTARRNSCRARRSTRRSTCRSTTSRTCRSRTRPGGGGGDVVIARKDRKATAFAIVPSALDIAATNGAGVGTGRSKVAVAADGVALVVWGEAGQVFARRVFEQHGLGRTPARDDPGGRPVPGGRGRPPGRRRPGRLELRVGDLPRVVRRRLRQPLPRASPAASSARRSTPARSSTASAASRRRTPSARRGSTSTGAARATSRPPRPVRPSAP